MISLMFSGSQTVSFLKGIFEAINFCTCHAQVGGSSSRHGITMICACCSSESHRCARICPCNGHRFDFWSPLSPRRVAIFFFWHANCMAGLLILWQQFFLARHRRCLFLLNVLFDVQVHCMGGVGWVGWAVWRGGMR